jgi:hypothetical protein
MDVTLAQENLFKESTEDTLQHLLYVSYPRLLKGFISKLNFSGLASKLTRKAMKTVRARSREKIQKK